MIYELVVPYNNGVTPLPEFMAALHTFWDRR